MNQFKIDVPRITFFVDDEWIPTSNPIEVVTILKELYPNRYVRELAMKYFTQVPLAKHYKQQIQQFKSTKEHLLSVGPHRIRISRDDGIINVTKQFQYAYIVNGEPYDIDLVNLTISYDPKKDLEIDITWDYTIHNFQNMNSSIILQDNSLFSVELSDSSFDSSLV